MKRKKGFALIELIAGVSIVVVVGICAWFAMTVLTRSTEVSGNRLIAQNYLQKSLKEVRRAAQVHFDDLASCSFPLDSSYSDVCGFDLPSKEYKDFTRTFSVTNLDGTMKMAVITIFWNELGSFSPVEIKSVVYFSQPPDLLPGNLKGMVTRVDALGTPIFGAKITLVNVNHSLLERATISRHLVAVDGENFNFDENGFFVLDPGEWKLSAQASGYYDYIHSNPVVISSNGEIFVDVKMVPLESDFIVEITDSTEDRNHAVELERR